MPNWAIAKPAKVIWLKLNRPHPNCEIVTIPQANWPTAMMPLATTGLRFARYLKDTWISGNPKRLALLLYSNPQPFACRVVGQEIPQFGQTSAFAATTVPH
jgi:hypothetical protein